MLSTIAFLTHVLNVDAAAKLQRATFFCRGVDGQVEERLFLTPLPSCRVFFSILLSRLTVYSSRRAVESVGYSHDITEIVICSKGF